MPKKTTGKQQSFVENYCNPNSDTFNDVAESMIKAGYSETYAKHNHRYLLDNIAVVASMEAYKVKIQAKIKYDYDQAILALNVRLTYLEGQAARGNIQAINAQTAILREKNDITGLHKQIIKQEQPALELGEVELQALADLARGYKVKLAEKVG